MLYLATGEDNEEIHTIRNYIEEIKIIRSPHTLSYCNYQIHIIKQLFIKEGDMVDRRYMKSKKKCRHWVFLDQVNVRAGRRYY